MPAELVESVCLRFIAFYLMQLFSAIVERIQLTIRCVGALHVKADVIVLIHGVTEWVYNELEVIRENEDALAAEAQEQGQWTSDIQDHAVPTRHVRP